MGVPAEIAEPELPFSLGKDALKIKHSLDLTCFPKSLYWGEGRWLIGCLVLGNGSSWREEWVLDHTLAGIKNGMYTIVRGV